jgi:arginase
MRLVDGALAIHGDLPTSSTALIEVPLEAGDELATGIARFSSLRMVSERVQSAAAEATASGASWSLTVGGDCSVELGAIAHVLELRERMAVLWFDAHPDLNTPETSPSGAFAGMVLRSLTGDGVAGLVPPVPLDPRLIVLVGARSIDPGEEDFIADHSLSVVPATQLADPQVLLDAIAATGATHVYIHIDLDVLDPGDIEGHDSPVPFGVSTAELLTAIRAITSRFTVAGAGITQFAPASPATVTNDLPTILRVVGALTS